MKDTVYERYKDEVLSDNTKSEDCSQCRDCIHWDMGGKFDSYRKAVCRKYPKMKPIGIITNKTKCEFKDRASQK